MLARLLSGALLCALLWASWTAWQAPQVSGRVAAVQRVLPERPGEVAELWRVVSRSMIVPSAAEQLGKSLRQRGLAGILVEHQEQTVLHAFDDPRTFKDRQDAVHVRNEWRKAGFDAELIKPDDRFGVALGRLYMAAYAQALQRRLENEKRPYTYHRRQLSIPTWRFTFAAAPYAEARELWSKVQSMGMADPVLMRESQFRAMFPEAPADKPAD